jgi:hypothetical protein
MLPLRLGIIVSAPKGTMGICHVTIIGEQFGGEEPTTGTQGTNTS